MRPAFSSFTGAIPIAPILSASQRIPPELFYEIVKYLQILVWADPYADPYGWTAATKVSKWWRRMAIGQPTLWNTVYSTKRTGLLKAYLEHTDGVPLRVVMDIYTARAAKRPSVLLLPFTAQPGSIVCSLRMKMDQWVYDELCRSGLPELTGDLVEFTAHIKAADSLSTFPKFPPVLKDASKLERLSLTNMTWGLTMLQECTSLKHLHLDQSMCRNGAITVGGILSVLRTMPLLESLRLVSSWDPDHNASNATNVHLPYLRSIALGNDAFCVRILARLTFPRTARLSVTVTHWTTILGHSGLENWTEVDTIAYWNPIIAQAGASRDNSSFVSMVLSEHALGPLALYAFKQAYSVREPIRSLRSARPDLRLDFPASEESVGLTFAMLPLNEVHRLWASPSPGGRVADGPAWAIVLAQFGNVEEVHLADWDLKDVVALFNPEGSDGRILFPEMHTLVLENISTAMADEVWWDDLTQALDSRQAAGGHLRQLCLMPTGDLLGCNLDEIDGVTIVVLD